MDETNRARTVEFVDSDCTRRASWSASSREEAIDSAADEVHSRLGSTTHISVLDADGACASVTCSNGSSRA